MSGGTKRLPRAVREQQMLDAAVKAVVGKIEDKDAFQKALKSAQFASVRCGAWRR